MSNSTRICHDSCSGDRGICINDGTECLCFSGHFGDLCDKPMEDYFPVGWLVARIILGIVFFLLFLLGTLIFLKIVRRGELHKPKNKIALHVLGAFILYDLWTSILYLVDYFGGTLIPMSAIAVYSSFSVFMGFYFIGAIRAGTKLMKINSNYNPMVTIEDIEDTLSKMNKWRIPFIIILCIITAYQVPMIVVVSIQSESYQLWAIGQLILNIVFYIVLCVAFFVYEKRLLSLLDKRETKEVDLVRSVSFRVRAFCIITLGTLIVVTVYVFLLLGPTFTFILKVLNSIQQWIVTLMIFSIYVDLTPSKLIFSLASLFTDVSTDTNSNTVGMTQSGHMDSSTDASMDV